MSLDTWDPHCSSRNRPSECFNSVHLYICNISFKNNFHLYSIRAFIYFAIRSKVSQIEDTFLIHFLSTAVDCRSEPSFLVCLGFPSRRGVLVCWDILWWSLNSHLINRSKIKASGVASRRDTGCQPFLVRSIYYRWKPPQPWISTNYLHLRWLVGFIGRNHTFISTLRESIINIVISSPEGSERAHFLTIGTAE